MKKFGIKIFFGILFCVLAIAAAIGFTVMALWNWLLPELFQLPEITFWQAIGLAVLTRLLFGTFMFGKGKRWGHHHCQQCGGHMHENNWFKEKMRKKFERKLEHMTPEQREQFRKSFLWSCTGGEDKPNPEEPKQDGI